MDIQEFSPAEFYNELNVQEFSPLIPTEFYNEPLNNFYHENMDTNDDSSDASDFTNEGKEVERYLMQYCEQQGFEYR